MNARLVGTSSVLRDIDREIDCIAQSDARVLITGETGVGKDVVAQLIHRRSQRKGQLVTINCAGLPDSLLESELFGHVRGSFTGAYRDKAGWLEQAQGGTVFLDEVAEMSLRMQALLLRFVENGEIQRLGSERVRRLDNVRVIAATNRSLVESVAKKEFREDLYHRLNVIHIAIAPLRDRPDDVIPLVTHFLDLFSGVDNLARPVISDEALAMLVAYSWPGNVRELSNVVERLVVRNRSDAISPEDLPNEISSHAKALAGVVRSKSRPTGDALYDRMVKGRESFWTVIYDPFRAHDLTRDDLRAVVTRGLRETRGSYRQLVTLFNLDVSDYRRLLNFLQKYDCRLPFQEFRMTLPPAAAAERANPSRLMAVGS